MSNETDSAARGRPGFIVMAVLVTLLVVLGAASGWSALAGDGERAVDLGVAAAAVAMLTVLVAAVRRPPVLDVRVVAGELRVRFHGLDILWSLKAGWFGGRDERELWDVRAGADVIDLRLAPPAPMSRLVLQVPDPNAVAQLVATATRDLRAAHPTREE